MQVKLHMLGIGRHSAMTGLACCTDRRDVSDTFRISPIWTRGEDAHVATASIASFCT